MAHFAKLDENNIVLAIEVVNDSDCLDENGDESEAVGREHQKTVHGWELWKQCSYNTQEGQHKLGGTPFRKNYPGIGDTYDASKNAFIRKKPFNSWVLNESKCIYEAPVTAPSVDDATEDLVWNETNTRWEKRLYSQEFGTANTHYWNASTSAWVSI